MCVFGLSSTTISKLKMSDSEPIEWDPRNDRCSFSQNDDWVYAPTRCTKDTNSTHIFKIQKLVSLQPCWFRLDNSLAPLCVHTQFKFSTCIQILCWECSTTQKQHLKTQQCTAASITLIFCLSLSKWIFFLFINFVFFFGCWTKLFNLNCIEHPTRNSVFYFFEKYERRR